MDEPLVAGGTHLLRSTAIRYASISTAMTHARGIAVYEYVVQPLFRHPHGREYDQSATGPQRNWFTQPLVFMYVRSTIVITGPASCQQGAMRKGPYLVASSRVATLPPLLFEPFSD